MPNPVNPQLCIKSISVREDEITVINNGICNGIEALEMIPETLRPPQYKEKLTSLREAKAYILNLIISIHEKGM